MIRGGETRRLRFRGAGHAAESLVLTFDDITRLMAAQRNAAWKDVARRIAHEIKNPLTPIQLSAERIRRKYRKDITSDLDTFDRCTETIIRQVGDIGRMVDEFSAFARMPAPRFAPADLAEMLRQAVFAQRFVDAETEVALEEPGEERLDQLRRADGRPGPDQHPQERRRGGRRAPRWPRRSRRAASSPAWSRTTSTCASWSRTTAWACRPRDRDRLTEPYVTTREKGTGLGLAIVKRIMEDHEGELVLTDALHGTGARVILKFPTTARLAAANAQNGVEEMI